MDAAQTLSDAELIASVRNGDLEAYGELYSRHHQAAERMARQLVPPADADDLAGDAFAKVLDALRGGGGPDVSFRAYLLTTVRRVHVDRLRAAKRVTATDDIASYEREPETFDDPTVTGFESVAAAKAFAALPERWQAVLWHTEVEGDKPAEVAPLLGLTPNGVSALAYRAREGLRQAYLQQHLADVASDRCRWATERLGAYVRGGLTKRENNNMREHLDECPRCTAVYLELVEVNSSLPALLAPALLGVAGVGYLSAAGVKAGGAGLIGALWQRATEHGARTAVITGGGVAVVVAAVVAALALSGDDRPVGGAPQDVISASQPPSTGQPPPSQATKPPSAQPTQPAQPTPVPTQPTQRTERTQPTQPAQVPTSGPTSVPTSAATSAPKSGPAPQLDEGLLTIGTATSDSRGRSASQSGQQNYQVDFVVSPPGSRTGKVALAIRYGDALSLTLRSTREWSCRSSAGTVRCTSTVSRPIPLRAIAHVADLRPQADGSLVATASTGRVTDTDAYSDIRVTQSPGRQPPNARLTETLQPLRLRRTRSKRAG